MDEIISFKTTAYCIERFYLLIRKIHVEVYFQPVNSACGKE